MTNKMNTQTQEVTGAVTTANALKMAIKEMTDAIPHLDVHFDDYFEAIQACKEALAQPAQEPVAFRNKTTGEFCTGGFEAKHLNQWKPLYTHPAPSWQGLSDAEILDRAAQIMVERHYKEKNHG